MIALGFATLAGLTLLARHRLKAQSMSATGGPVYEGISLAEWLSRINEPGAQDRSAEAAVKSIGTSGIPFLLRIVDLPPSNPVPRWLADSDPWGIGYEIGRAFGYNDYYYNERLAARAWQILGTNAIPSILTARDCHGVRVAMEVLPIGKLPLPVLLSLYDGSLNKGATFAVAKELERDFNAFLRVLMNGSESERKKILDFLTAGLGNSCPLPGDKDGMFLDTATRFMGYESDVARLLESPNQKLKLLAIQVSPFCGVYGYNRAKIQSAIAPLVKIAAESTPELTKAGNRALDQISQYRDYEHLVCILFVPRHRESGRASLLGVLTGRVPEIKRMEMESVRQ